ncbi:MAG TPA: hypothetical protein VK660_10330 [Xanthomonadaceae bacterium]|jgi:hypothetical protein|nr:hypothetical protein [Xanthomonadaceae bacterium]
MPLNEFSPSVILLIPALLLLLVAILVLAGIRRSRGIRRLLRGLVGLVFFLLALTLGGLGLVLHDYLHIAEDVAIAHLTMKQMGPQRFQVGFIPASGNARNVDLHGDQWEVDARVIRWKLPAQLAGFPPLYQLERIGGRYRDIVQERAETRSVQALNDTALFDVWTLKHRYPGLLPFVDADYGSGAYLPMVDGGRFDLFLNTRGGLVAKPSDQATRDKLTAAGW